MKNIFLSLLLIQCLNGMSQINEGGKIGFGLNFITTLTLDAFSIKYMDNGIESRTFYSGNGDPVIGAGAFLDYHFDKHTAGVSYSITFYDYDYHSFYTDLVDSDGNPISRYQSDYVTHLFHNFHALYKYVVEDDQMRLGLVVGPGYHNVQLEGNAYISYQDHQSWDRYEFEDYSGITSVNYWSLKTGIELSYFPIKRLGLYGFVGYDFAFGESEKYAFDYDNELIESGEFEEISRIFNPSSIGEIRLGIHFVL